MKGFEFTVFIVLLLATVPLLGRYMAYVFADNSPRSIPILNTLEKTIYRLCSIDPNEEMGWKDYAKAMVCFNLLSFAFLFSLQLLQGLLPLNPQNFPGVEPSLAFNTAVSFVTNTNWQAYGGETTMSYLTQMLGLTVQNFVSPAAGNAVLLAFIRGLSRKSAETMGNFWADMIRTIVYLLLPLCVIFSIFLVSQGVIQNFNSYVEAKTLAGDIQIIPMGPAASQVAIKQLGSNGGGFFNANSTHPFENPTPLTNFFESFSLLCIPAATVYMYGILIQSKKRAWVIFSVMFTLWAIGLIVAETSEHMTNPILESVPNFEGKEVRIGAGKSVFWAVSTTSTSNGSVNSMHSSLSPLAGGVAIFNIMLGEAVFGGIGTGLSAMLMFAILTVFLAGLMVGRTPEYLGKKIEKVEMQWVMLAILTPCSLILFGAAIACLLPSVLSGLGNGGPHGLSEILYAFASSAANNGSSFAGFNANTVFLNITLALIMWICRMTILVSSLAVGGALIKKNTSMVSLGTFATDKPLFGVLLFCVLVVFAALTFFPALSLGPIVEHILMMRGQSF